MIRKLLFVSLGCLFAASAMGGACHGQACRYTYFDKDKDGCLEIRNSGPEDIEVKVYTAASGSITLRVASGDTEKVYKTGRLCVPAADYVRSDAKFSGDKGDRSIYRVSPGGLMNSSINRSVPFYLPRS